MATVLRRARLPRAAAVSQRGADGGANRRRGVATLLVEKAEAWGREQGASVVLLDTWAESPVSVPFWERMGYGRRSIVFRKPL